MTEPGATTRITASLLRVLAAAAVSAACIGACGGGAKHPEKGQPNEEDYCAERPKHENNCMACSSQPGCGWCDSPDAGRAHCQPGTLHSAPATCRGGWALSSEDCATPPPPPPPPAAAAPKGGEDDQASSAGTETAPPEAGN